MKLTVFNGSPKGDISTSLQYVNYLGKCFPMHDFHVVNVSQKIQKIEKKNAYFQSIIEDVKQSDGIIWCTPVYYFHVPSQLKRFIELILEDETGNVFKGKYATAVTTSGFMLDNTAHNYIHAVSEDLGMEYVEGYSASIEHLTIHRERENLLNFAKLFFQSVQEKLPTEKRFEPVVHNVPEYVPGEIQKAQKTGRRKITVFHDSDGDVNLTRMIDVFNESIDADVDVVNINTINMNNGCLGCWKCCYDGACVQKDGYMAVIKDRMMSADAIIFAGSIRDRYLSSTWKMFIDRLLFLGHVPFLSGRHIGFLISGPLRQIPNLRQIFEALGNIAKANIVGIVTDEYEDSGTVTSLLKSLAKLTEQSIDWRFKKPVNFLGVGVHKILRDVVYENKSLLRMDHLFFKKLRLYDFSQKKISFRMMNLIMTPLLKIASVRKWFYKNIGRLTINQYQRIIRKIDI